VRSCYGCLGTAYPITSPCLSHLRLSNLKTLDLPEKSVRAAQEGGQPLCFFLPVILRKTNQGIVRYFQLTFFPISRSVGFSGDADGVDAGDDGGDGGEDGDGGYNSHQNRGV
jgi:hypothetical protein